MDDLVLCTIQKKKHCQEGGERKKSTKRKTKEEGLELEAVPAAAAAGDVEQGGRAGTTEGEDEDHVQRALMEAAAEPLPELAYHAPAAGVDNFNGDPDQNMPYYYLTNRLSPVPTPSQETLMAPASGDNHILIHQQNYYINHSMNMKNSQSFHVQETPPQELLPYLDTKMTAPQGGGNTMDHMLQNMFVNMTPSQAPLVLGTGTYLSPRRSKSDVRERSAELPRDKPNRPLKSEDARWSSPRQAKLPARELNNPYVSLPFVPTPQQETMVMALAAREHNHTAMHQRNYVNHSMNMRNLQFHVQATLPQEEFLPYSSTKVAAPLGGGSIADHHMLENRIANVMPAAEAHNFTGFFPGLSNSNYGHLSTRMDHPGPSSVLFPSQQSHGAGSRTVMQGLLLNNQVNLDHQNSAAASMVGYDQRNGFGLPKIV
jgi:hypothetical protein